MAPPAHTPDRPGRIASTTRGELAVRWLGTVAWNGMFGTVAGGILLGRLETTAPVWDRVLVGLGCLGPVFLFAAVRESVRAWRFRSVTLEPDPPEGSLGGELGGALTVPVRNAPADAFRMAVSCSRIVPGDDSERESVVWRRELRPVMRRSAGGLRLEFSVPLPDDLPPSGPPEGDRHRWAVRVLGDLPGLDLDAVYEVPVARHAEPRMSTYASAPPPDPDLGGVWTSGRGITASRERGATVLRFGVARSFPMGVAFAMFGLLCVGSGTFIGVATLGDRAWTSAFDVAFGAVGGLFVLAFGSVGALLVGLGGWLAGNTLRVDLSPGSIRVRRRFLGIPLGTREIAVDDVAEVEARVVSQSGSGPRASVGYELTATLRNGDRVVVGDGIRGAERVERLVAAFRRDAGLTRDATVVRGGAGARLLSRRAGSPPPPGRPGRRTGRP